MRCANVMLPDVESVKKAKRGEGFTDLWRIQRLIKETKTKSVEGIIYLFLLLFFRSTGYIQLFHCLHSFDSASAQLPSAVTIAT